MNWSCGPAAVAASLALAAGCTHEAPVETEEFELEIYTYWTADNMADNHFAEIVVLLTDAFTQEYPDVLVRNGSVHWAAREEGDYFSTVERRFEENDPPDIHQINGLQRLAPALEAGRIAPLESLFEGKQFALAAENVSVEGVPVGVPMNAIRDNVLFINLEVFRAAGVTDSEISTLKGPDATFDDLFSVADKIAAYYANAERDGTPFGIYATASNTASSDPNIKYPWSYKDVFMDCILPGTLGLSAWQSLLDAPSSEKWHDPRVEQALLNLKRYVDRANQDFMRNCPGCAPWNTIVDGNSAMVVLGDWYVSTLRDSGMVYGKDWDAFACPGTGGAFVGHTDMWVLSPNAAHPDNARAFLELALRPEIQVAFNAKFGALPAVHVDPSQLSDDNGFDGYTRAAYADLENEGFTWRTEAQTGVDFRYLAVLGPYAESVLGLDMEQDQAAVMEAVTAAVDAFASECAQSGDC